MKQYELLLESAAETAEACLDMDGVAFLLAWIGELIRDLTTAGCFRSARLAIQKLCKAANVDWAWSEYDELAAKEKQVWLNLFAEVLMEHVVTVAE